MKIYHDIDTFFRILEKKKINIFWELHRNELFNTIKTQVYVGNF